MKILDLTVLSWGCVTMSFYAKVLYSQFATVHAELPYSGLLEILNSDNNRYNIMTFKNGLVYTIAMVCARIYLIIFTIQIDFVNVMSL